MYLRRHLTWDYQKTSSSSGSDCTGGIQCDVPVILLVLGILGALILIFLGSYVIYRHLKYRRAFDTGSVPAQMLISGYLRDSTETGKEEPENFVFKVHRKKLDGNDSLEDCPICLKSSKAITRRIVLPCSHQLCEPCFYRIISRQRLHSTCPLCRGYMAEGDGNRGPGSGQDAVNDVELGVAGRSEVEG